MAPYLTQDDRRIFGDELLDVAQRSALHVMAPELQRLEDENVQMRARLMRADIRDGQGGGGLAGLQATRRKLGADRRAKPPGPVLNSLSPASSVQG